MEAADLLKSQEKINNLMFMDDIKIFAKNEKELETLIQTIRIHSQSIKVEFKTEKCAILIIRKEKNKEEKEITKGIELPNQESIRTLRGKESNKYLGILEAITTKQTEIKKNRKGVPPKNKKTSRNSTQQQKSESKEYVFVLVNALERYSGPFFNWTVEELRNIDH